jgi:hypothetical protein
MGLRKETVNGREVERERERERTLNPKPLSRIQKHSKALFFANGDGV